VFAGAQPEALRKAGEYGKGGLIALAVSAFCFYIAGPEMKEGGSLLFLAIMPAILLLLGAYWGFIEAASALCRAFTRETDADLPTPCFWLIAVWTALHIAVPIWGVDFELSFVDYAEGHGWYVAALFIVAIVGYLVFSNGLKVSKRPAEFKAMWGVLNPGVAILAALAMAPKTEPDGYYYLGIVVVLQATLAWASAVTKKSG